MAKILAEISKSEAFVGSAHSAETIKRKARELSSRRAEHLCVVWNALISYPPSFRFILRPCRVLWWSLLTTSIVTVYRRVIVVRVASYGDHLSYFSLLGHFVYFNR